MEHLNDIKLIQLSLEGDARAFECLVKRHYQTVFRIAFKWSGVRQDAEDIAQEVCVKLARKLKTFGGRSAFKTWLYRITINCAKDFIRKSATKRGYEKAYAAEQIQNNPGSHPNEHLATKHLYQALDSLPKKQKAAVLLVFSEGFSHKDAGRILKCPEATVSWRIFQARKRLKKSLEREI